MPTVSEIINEAQRKRVARGGLTVEVARVIRPEGFGVAYGSSAPGAAELLPTVRQRYQQADALQLAVEVLHLVAARLRDPSFDLRRHLADDEAAAWRDLLLPTVSTATSDARLGDEA